MLADVTDIFVVAPVAFGVGLVVGMLLAGSYKIVKRQNGHQRE